MDGSQKQSAYLFTIGVEILKYLTVTTIFEIFSIIREANFLVIYHPKREDQSQEAHIHAVFPVKVKLSKVQQFERSFKSHLRGKVNSDKGLNLYLKANNVLVDDLDLQQLTRCMFGQDDTQSNSQTVTDNNDPITKKVLEMANANADSLTCDSDCLSCLKFEDAKAIYINSGTVPSEFYVTEEDEIGGKENENEAIR